MIEKAPFQSLVFALTDRVNGRVLFQMIQQDSSSYELHVEKGPASQPSVNFTRTLPLKTAQNLRDALAALGVFGWEEDYTDSTDDGSRRWSLKIVFQEGVFTQESRGANVVPEGFDGLLEEFYQLDLPRPGADDAPGITTPPAMPFALPNMGALFEGLPEGGPDASVFAEIQRAMEELQTHPERFQQQLKEEFRMLPREQQDQMLDMLAATGMGSREWWDKFLRG